MTMSSRRHVVSFVAMALAVAGFATAGCGSHHTSGPSESDLKFDALQHARLIVSQYALDLGLVRADEVGPGAVVNGIVVNGAQFNTWYEAGGQNQHLSGSASVTIADEEVKAEALLRHLPQWQSAADRHNKVPRWTPEQTAHTVLVQELVDSQFVQGTVTQGFYDPMHHVIASPAVDAWYAAHRDDRLPGNSTMTLADEVARIVTVINTPKP